jgi:uncharacterized protein YndB with AHSA1/START domain
MVRRFSAPPSRLYRCWTDPEELVRWFPERIEGSLALATRSILVFPDQRVSWDVTVLQSDRRFEFRWPWLPDSAWETTVSIALEPAGYGTLMTLTDGPFDVRVPGVLDAYAEANEGSSKSRSLMSSRYPSNWARTARSGKSVSPNRSREPVAPTPSRRIGRDIGATSNRRDSRAVGGSVTSSTVPVGLHSGSRRTVSCSRAPGGECRRAPAQVASRRNRRCGRSPGRFHVRY